MALTAEQREAIAAERGQVAQTRRATVPALEEVLYEPIPVLDHGFIRVIDYMGGDEAVVQAARVSYGRGTRRVHRRSHCQNSIQRRVFKLLVCRQGRTL